MVTTDESTTQTAKRKRLMAIFELQGLCPFCRTF